MKRLTVFFLAAAAVLAAPAAASADGFLSPYVGVNFGGDTTKKSTVYGGAIGFVGAKAGFEVDFGYTPEFFGDDTLDVDGKLVTVMGNVLFGGKRGGFSPYFALGGGLIRTDITVIGDVADLEAAKNSFGGNVGGGFFAGGKSVTVRADVRYFRAFNFDDGLDFGLNLDVIKGTLRFWRGTVGVGFMW
ncbi:MAG: outer membrane beta-barrel protein [Vicinamibacteria bacterium]|nr:outer membrane beta-barrel protein [Vicinamibacteria bacterium]